MVSAAGLYLLIKELLGAVHRVCIAGELRERVDALRLVLLWWQIVSWDSAHSLSSSCTPAPTFSRSFSMSSSARSTPTRQPRHGSVRGYASYGYRLQSSP